jgi:3-oxoacyl-[acyl-carrier protein] reductase
MSADGSRVALITGAGGIDSIGRAIALRFAREGLDVVVSDVARPRELVSDREHAASWRGIASVKAEVEALGRRSLAIECDLSKESEIEALIEATLERLGRLDVLVNSARAFNRRDGVHIAELTEEEWDWTMAVNLRGPMTTAKHAVSAFRRANGAGSIVNISSMAGVRPVAGGGAYAASKAALNILTRILALELAPLRIRVNAVCPGVIATGRVTATELRAAERLGISHSELRDATLRERIAEIPLGRVGTPDDVANAAWFLSSPESEFMTGQCLNVDGGVVLY